MGKLKYISTAKTEDLPDYIIQEIHDLCEKLGETIAPLLFKVNPNVSLAAFNWIHAVVIKQLISNDPQEVDKAVKLTCLSLTKNIEILKNLQEEDL